MAAVAEGRNDAGIYWIEDRDQQSVVFVPGLSKKMGLKSMSITSNERKFRGKSSVDFKQKSGKKSGITDLSTAKQSSTKTLIFPDVTDNPPQVLQFSQTEDHFHKTQAKSKASLKDLCPEDKRRIANLIEELARVSEEKEESVQRLRDEQETFEKKIQQLEEQNQFIIQERESLQQQYRECQELLGLYQQYLSQQQEKLNKSIAQLNQIHSHGKMASSERTLSRACCGRGMALDGSYLDPDSSRRTVCTQAFRGGPPSMPSCCSQQASGSSEQGTAGANSCLQGRWSELVPEMHLNKELAIGLRDVPEPTRSYENGIELDAGLRGILPPVDRRDWEEKRQRLLLQKKQLEVERERLQARLAQQEERLLKQNQELRESRLNYSKIQQAATELEQTFNKIAPTKVAQASVVVESEPGDGSVQTVKGSVRQPVNDVQPQTCNGSVQLPEHRPSCELSCATKKDMATSPVQPSSFQQSSLPPVLLSYPRTPKPSKLDSSLIELLDIFSPCENTNRNKLVSTAHRSLTVPHQAFSVARTSLLSPRGRTQASQEEMQESQILEDIFFIC